MRLALLLAALAACGPSARVISAPVARTGATAEGPRELAERLWAERLDPARLRQAIAAWKRAVAAADDDARAWLGLAHAEFFLADGFLAFDPAARDELVRTFEDGAAHAERGLRALSRRFEERRRAGADVDEAAAELAADAGVDRALLAGLLYFWGENLIRWADLEGRLAAMRVYKSVNRAMELAGKLDPTIDHGGPDRYFGSFYAEAPGIAGGDLAKSRAAFERALAIAPGYLETLVHFARHYAKRSGDAALYAETLRRIAATDPASVPDALPEQEIARRKAARLPPSF